MGIYTQPLSLQLGSTRLRLSLIQTGRKTSSWVS